MIPTLTEAFRPNDFVEKTRKPKNILDTKRKSFMSVAVKG